MASQVADHEHYKDSYHRCVDWVGEMRQRLHHIKDTTGSKDQVEDRLNNLEELKDELSEGQERYADLHQVASVVQAATAPTGSQQIAEEMRTLKEQLDALSMASADTQETLEQCIMGLDEFVVEEKQLATWLDGIESQIICKSDTSALHAAPEEHIQEIQVNVNGLVQDCGNSSALALEIPQSCTKSCCSL